MVDEVPVPTCFCLPSDQGQRQEAENHHSPHVCKMLPVSQLESKRCRGHHHVRAITQTTCLSRAQERAGWGRRFTQTFKLPLLVDFTPDETGWMFPCSFQFRLDSSGVEYEINMETPPPQSRIRREIWHQLDFLSVFRTMGDKHGH